MRAGKDTNWRSAPLPLSSRELPVDLEMGILGEYVDTLTVPRSQMEAQRPRARELLSDPKTPPPSLDPQQPCNGGREN